MDRFTVEQFDQALKDGQYAWPGGYPRFFLMDDGEALSFKAAEENAEQIRASIKDNARDGWQVVGVDINYEDHSLFCAHSGERIPSAYAEDEAVVLHGPQVPIIPPK